MAVDLTHELISVAQVKTEVIDAAQFDTELLKRHILDSQRHYMKQSLGKDLYELLLEQNKDGNLTAVNSTLLLDYIRPSLAWYTVWEASPYMRVNITSAGFMINFDDQAEQADFRDFDLIRKQILARADLLRRVMLDFIKDNLTDYPDFSPGKDKYTNQNTFSIY